MDTFILRDDFSQHSFNVAIRYFDGFAVLHIGASKTRYSDTIKVKEIPKVQQAILQLTFGAPVIMRKFNNNGVLISKVVIQQFREGFAIRVQKYKKKGTIYIVGSLLSIDEMSDISEAIDNIGLVE